MSTAFGRPEEVEGPLRGYNAAAMNLVPALLALALSAAPSPSAPVTLVGAGALGPGGAAWLAEVGYPQLSVTYAQGLDEWNDLGGTMGLRWTTGEMVLAACGGGNWPAMPEAGRASGWWPGPWFDFGATWIYPENQANLGVLVAPGVGWTASAGPGLASVTLDLGLEWAFQRGMGLAFLPRLGVAYEAPGGEGRHHRRPGRHLGALGQRERRDPRRGPEAPGGGGGPLHVEGLLGLPAPPGPATSGPRRRWPARRSWSTDSRYLSISSPSTAPVIRCGTSRPDESMKTTVGMPTTPYLSKAFWNASVSLGAVHLQGDEAPGGGLDARVGPGGLVELLAGGAPLRPEVDDDRLPLRAGLGDGRHLVLVEVPGQPVSLGAGAGRGGSGGVDNPAHDEGHAEPLRNLWRAGPWKLPLKAPSRTPIPAKAAAASAAARDARKMG